MPGREPLRFIANEVRHADTRFYNPVVGDGGLGTTYAAVVVAHNGDTVRSDLRLPWVGGQRTVDLSDG